MFAAWVDEVEIANGFLMKAEEHGTMQRNRQNASILKLSLLEWNAIHLFSKSVRTFSAKLVMHNIDTMIRTCFDNWKYSVYLKIRYKVAHIHPKMGRLALLCSTYIQVSRQCSEPQTQTDNPEKN